MTRRALVVLVAVASPFGLGACGSSSSPSTASAPPAKPSSATTSTSAFIASADAICKAGNAAVAPIKTISSSTSDTAAQQILQNASGAYQVAANELGALKAPGALAAPWHVYVGNVKLEVTDISGMADALGAGDSATFARDLSQARQLTQQGRAAIAGKGFSHCGRGS